MSPLNIDAEYVHTDHVALGPECTPRKVLISPELMMEIVAAANGRRVTIDWGDPDADGFYTPTITERGHSQVLHHVERPHRLVAREDVEDGFIDAGDANVTVL